MPPRRLVNQNHRRIRFEEHWHVLLEHPVGHLWRQALGRLIEDDDLRPDQEHAGHGEHLAPSRAEKNPANRVMTRWASRRTYTSRDKATARSTSRSPFG